MAIWSLLIISSIASSLIIIAVLSAKVVTVLTILLEVSGIHKIGGLAQGRSFVVLQLIFNTEYLPACLARKYLPDNQDCNIMYQKILLQYEVEAVTPYCQRFGFTFLANCIQLKHSPKPGVLITLCISLSAMRLWILYNILKFSIHSTYKNAYL